MLFSTELPEIRPYQLVRVATPERRVKEKRGEDRMASTKWKGEEPRANQSFLQSTIAISTADMETHTHTHTHAHVCMCKHTHTHTRPCKRTMRKQNNSERRQTLTSSSFAALSSFFWRWTCGRQCSDRVSGLQPVLRCLS